MHECDDARRLAADEVLTKKIVRQIRGLFSSPGELELDLNTWTAPRKDWTCWKTPDKKLPIDEWIQNTRQVTRKNTPKLLSRNELATSGIKCPYWTARELLSWAIFLSHLDAKKYEIGRKKLSLKCEELEQKALSAANLLDDILSDSDFSEAMGMTTNNIDGSIRSIQQQNKYAKALFQSFNIKGFTSSICNLKDLANLAKTQKNSLTRKGPKPDFYKREFIKHIGTAYYILIGNAPPASGASFRELVRVAWETLEGEKSTPISDKYIGDIISQLREDANWKRWDAPPSIQNNTEGFDAMFMDRHPNIFHPQKLF